MRLRIITTADLLAPLCLAVPGVAENPAYSRQLLGERAKFEPLPFSLLPPQSQVGSLFAQPILLAQTTWKDFSSSKGKFAILMPGTPTEETEKDKEDGTVYNSFKVEGEQSLYFVQYSDIPEIAGATSEEVKKILDNTPSEFVKGANAKLLGQRSISLTGYSGREFSFAINKEILGKGLVYLVEKRLYIVVAVTPEQDNAQKFIDSFRLMTP